jgi:hypothetical protein
VSVLAEVVAAAGEALQAHALREPGSAHFAEVVQDPDRLFVLEAVREGYLMHYGMPRAFREVDEDFRLLAGDALFALGLSRLAERGDLKAIAELSDLISLSAEAHATNRPQAADELWEASARALSEAGGPGARAAAGTLALRSEV